MFDRGFRLLPCPTLPPTPYYFYITVLEGETNTRAGTAFVSQFAIWDHSGGVEALLSQLQAQLYSVRGDQPLNVTKQAVEQAAEHGRFTTNNLVSFRRKAASHVRVRVLGGSLTYGSYACEGLPGYDGGLSKICNKHAYWQVLFQHLRRRGGNHDVAAHGGGGFGSKYYGSCLEELVPLETDLVIIDVSINDIDGPRTAREKAFLFMISQLFSRGVRAIVSLCWRMDKPVAMKQRSMKRVYRIQDENCAMASKLANRDARVSVLSYPNFLTSACKDVPMQANTLKRPFWSADRLHAGHLGHAMMGTLLTLLLMRDTPRAHGHRLPLETKEPTLLASRHGSGSVCFLGERLRDVVASAGDGWAWTDEGRGKWGYVFTRRAPPLSNMHTQKLMLAIGQSMVARPKLDDWIGQVRRESSGSTVNIMAEVGYLQSYGEDYGAFHIDCMPCRCWPGASWFPFPDVTTRNDGARHSVWESTLFFLQCRASDLDALQLGIHYNRTVVPSANGSKVKILGLKLHQPDLIRGFEYS